MTHVKVVQNEKPIPFLMAFRIWILTSIVFGICSGIDLAVLEKENVFFFIPITIGAVVCSLPVLLTLTFSCCYIDDLPMQPVPKIRRLVLTCAGCILPYAFMGGNIYTDSYENAHYLKEFMFHSLVVFAILFFCSTVALLLNTRIIRNFFSADSEYHNI